MSKKVICFYGGPGCGKSTISAQLFALMKIKGINVELVREYIKDWVWEKRSVLPGDQVYIFAKQSRKERILFNDVDIIITDSPIWMSAVYERRNEPEPYVIPVAIEKQLGVARSFGFNYLHVFIERDDSIGYQQEGRFQNLDDAKKIDVEIKNYLVSNNIPFTSIASTTPIIDIFRLVDDLTMPSVELSYP